MFEVIEAAKLLEDEPRVAHGWISEPIEKEEEASPPPKPEEEKVVSLFKYSDTAFTEGYSRTPTYVDQYERLPGTIKEGELQAAVYDLLIPDQLAAYNTLLAQHSAPHSPRVILNKVETQQFSGGWKVLAHYRPIWYKELHK